MWVAPWLCTLLAVGPTLDPLEGSTVTAADATVLPAGGFAASVADLWLLELVNLRQQGGALGLFEPMALSAYGWSWRDTRFSLNRLDLTDPGRSGEPLLEAPEGWADATAYRGLWTSEPTYGWSLAPSDAKAKAKVSGRGGLAAPLGGGTWVPKGLMDREPALASGATPVRRELHRGVNLSADARLPFGRAAFEHVTQTLRFPTLVDGARTPYDAEPALLDDEASRTTALLAYDCDWCGRPARVLAMGQTTRRAHADAEFRHPAAATLASHTDALATQLAVDLARGPGFSLDARIGAALRHESLEPNGAAPLVRDLEGEWLWTGRERAGVDSLRQRYELVVDGNFGADELATVRASAGTGLVGESSHFPQDRAAVTFERAGVPENRALYLSVFDTGQRAHERLDHARLEVEARPTLAGVAVRATAALDYAAAIASSGAASVHYVSPALGVAASTSLGGTRLVALIRHEPVALGSELARYIDPAQPSELRYLWNDNGDLVPEVGEEGALVARYGGAANVLGSHLARPTSSLLALGWQAPPLGPWRLSTLGVAHLMRGSYTVALAGPAAASYSPVRLGDVAGASPYLADEDRALTVYARAPGTEGQEIYELRNAARAAYYLGAEVRLEADTGDWWFVNLGVAGYYSLGTAAFGLFADRNDIGAIDPASADPNAGINSFGSVDAARAYHIKLLAGVRPFEGASAALALRYRDGEPMTRLLAVEGLPQGPTLIMTQSRGNPTPRFTFHMTLDVRLRYAREVAGTTTALRCDIYNLLGSGTELLEDTRSGPTHRQALEMMPGRALVLTGEVQF